MRFLTKDKLPMNKGRWYKNFIESNGTTRTLTSTDLTGSTISGGNLIFPKDFIITDVQVECHTSGGTAASTASYLPMRKRQANGNQSIALPAVAVFDWCNIFVKGYFE